MRIELTTPPAEEPISLTEAKAQVRQTTSADDAMISGLIIAARAWAEGYTGRRFVTQRWAAHFDDFTSERLILEMLSPVSSVVSISYVDSAGITQSLNINTVQLVKSAPAEIILAYGQSWPSIRAQVENVVFTVECGYGGASGVPDAIKGAIKLHVEAHYNRDERQFETLMNASKALLDAYCVPRM